jgi:hypothetical protein
MEFRACRNLMLANLTMAREATSLPTSATTKIVATCFCGALDEADPDRKTTLPPLELWPVVISCGRPDEGISVASKPGGRNGSDPDVPNQYCAL